LAVYTWKVNDGIAILSVGQLVKKYREKKKKHCMVFIDLEEVFDRVLREV